MNHNASMKIQTFWRMPYKEKLRFFINVCLCGIAKVAIQCLSYQRLSVYFGCSCQMLVASTLISKEQIQQVLTIRRAIALAARYTPWNSSCLTQALIAKFWCQRYHIPYLLFIGLAKESHQPLKHKAHAWITAGPIAVTGGHGFETHQVICSYSNVL